MRERNQIEMTRLRYNIMTAIVYIIGIILLAQLFNLQIVKGEEYREQSNTRLTRESTLEATRGKLLDRTGNVLATSEMGFSVELYNTKLSKEELNQSILNIINVLEKNGDTYCDSLPIAINPFEYTFENEEKLSNWKTENKLPETATAEEAFYILKRKYGITSEDVEETRKILRVRYEITIKGYSATKGLEIANNISRESVLEFKERSVDFPGLNVVTKSVRVYEMGSLASHIIGYIGKIDSEELKERKDIGYENNDYIGKTGIESIFEEYLKGEDGKKQIDMAVDGTITGEYITKEATAGSDIVLTIDANLQAIAENALRNNIEKIRSGGFSKVYDAKGGSVVVMNVKTGEVLAMASYPDYDPSEFINGISVSKWNEYRDSKALFNRAIQGAYAPGSIFKMVSAIAGLETGVITRTEKINDTGVYPLAHNPVCWYWTDYHRGHGYLNVSDAIKHSCNYFFYEVGNRMGIDALEEYARYFGLGKKTGIELPSENAGKIASRKTVEEQGGKWYLSDTLSAAIGQSENNFTPLQIAKYISMLTNGGKNVKTTIVKSIINADNQEIKREEIDKFVQSKLGLPDDDGEDLNIDEENLNTILEGMRSVTSDTQGTAYNIFKNFNIEVGGKTGSAQTATTDVNAWFAGFAPFDDPEIAVVVMVENGGHGNYTAEVARDIIAEYFGMNTSSVEEDITAKPYTESTR